MSIANVPEEIRTVTAIDNLSVAAVGGGLQTPEGTQILRRVLAVASVFGLCSFFFFAGSNFVSRVPVLLGF